jgi:DNA transposition AAA+ family ATPase
LERSQCPLDSAGIRVGLSDLGKNLVAGLRRKILVLSIETSRGQLPENVGNNTSKRLKAIGNLLG